MGPAQDHGRPWVEPPLSRWAPAAVGGPPWPNLGSGEAGPVCPGRELLTLVPRPGARSCVPAAPSPTSAATPCETHGPALGMTNDQKINL